MDGYVLLQKHARNGRSGGYIVDNRNEKNNVICPPRVQVIGVPISAVTMESALAFVAENLEEIRGSYICVSNVHTTVMAREDPAYHDVQSNSVMSLPDGKPLTLSGRRKAPAPMERVTGYEFLRKIFMDPRFAGKKHFFYGTHREDLEQMIPRICKDYPEVNICGYEPSVFRPMSDEEVSELAERINACEPDFIWIAIGAPRQENLMNRLNGQVNGVMIAVGGVFNILSGKAKNAPQWMQELCLEWVYRLLNEPRRLFKRYLVTNSKFIWYCWRDRH